MRQRNRTSASAAIAIMVFGGGLAMAPLTPLHAADCLTAPSGAAPKGSHWYYRLERETKRKCWYTKAKSATPAPAVADATTTPDPTDAAQQPAPTSSAAAAAPPRNLSDARAEYVPTSNLTDSSRGNATLPPQPTEPFVAADAGSAAPSPDLQNQRVAFANRWLERQAAQSEVASSSGETAAVTPEPAASVPVAATPAPVAADNSLSMLIAGLAGALALAGLIAHLVMRFGPPRPIIRREQPLHDDALYSEAGYSEAGHAAAPAETASAASWRAQSEVASARIAPAAAAGELEDEPPPMNWLRIARDRTKATPSDDAIEQLLAKAPRPS